MSIAMNFFMEWSDINGKNTQWTSEINQFMLLLKDRQPGWNL